MYLVSADEMREMDRRTIEDFGLPGRILMENAGREASRVLLEQFPDIMHEKVAVMAGRGNNGGDGFVIARYLAQRGIETTVYILAERSTLEGDAAANLELLSPLQVPVVEIKNGEDFSANEAPMRRQSIWVDAILGTGLRSEVRGHFRRAIEFINHQNRPVLAVDIPSGLSAETGQPCGACVFAHTTVTFAFAKPGHLMYPGANFTGNLQVVDIGIPSHIAAAVNPRQHLLTQELIAGSLVPRAKDAHKGNTGHLLVIAGSPGKTGAAAMTGMSALRAGTGLVTLGIPKGLNAILECQILEAMTYPLAETVDGVLGPASFDAVAELAAGKRCVALGPGIGTAEETKSLVHRILQEIDKPMVIDADGLNSLAGYADILRAARQPTVLTPHPGEMARLMDKTVSDIQKDRIHWARVAAESFRAHVVLKGARTVIAHPDGKVFVNPTGNPGMASGGMGDVLTGIIAGLIAQGYPQQSATHMGVYLHGSAADHLATRGAPYGFIASEVMNAIPEQIGKLHP